MKELKVYIEKEGSPEYVGKIIGEHPEDAGFQYDQSYIEKGLPAISISLPVREEIFTPEESRNFFEGLLPEGFTRRTVAGWLHVDEKDYLSILANLGSECLGAIRIIEDQHPHLQSDYKKLTLRHVKALAKEGASKTAEIVINSHLSLTGASGKVGLMLHEGEWYQPIYDAPSTHIVKQSHVRFDSIVLNEHLALMTAKEIGLEVTDSFIVDVGKGRDEDVLFASKRYDRLINHQCEVLGGIKKPLRLHQEDFAQAMGIASVNKYEKPGQNYLADMFDIIRKHSSNPLEDGLKLWDLTIFDYLIGNTDNHIKNRSLLYNPSLSSVRLAPIYDVISTTIYQSSTKDMAYNIGGKYNIKEIDRACFGLAAEQCGLGKRIALKHFDQLADAFENALKNATDKLLEKDIEKAAEIRDRILESCGYANLK